MGGLSDAELGDHLRHGECLGGDLVRADQGGHLLCGLRGGWGPF